MNCLDTTPINFPKVVPIVVKTSLYILKCLNNIFGIHETLFRRRIVLIVIDATFETVFETFLLAAGTDIEFPFHLTIRTLLLRK